MFLVYISAFLKERLQIKILWNSQHWKLHRLIILSVIAKQAVQGIINLVPKLTAGCCHLAKLMA